MTVEILSECTYVGHLLENIECNEKDFLSVLSSVLLGDNVNGIKKNSKGQLLSF